MSSFFGGKGKARSLINVCTGKRREWYERKLETFLILLTVSLLLFLLLFSRNVPECLLPLFCTHGTFDLFDRSITISLPFLTCRRIQSGPKEQIMGQKFFLFAVFLSPNRAGFPIFEGKMNCDTFWMWEMGSRRPF